MPDCWAARWDCPCAESLAPVINWYKTKEG